MSFNLFITSASGERTFKTLRSPYPSREHTRSTARHVLMSHDVPQVEADAFTALMADTPLGETVRHEVSGVAFCTEEV
jgi:hypothetical protein